MGFFQKTPESVQEYLLDDAAVDAEDRAQEVLGYDHDAWVRVMDVAWDEIFFRIPEQDFRARVAKVAGDRDPKEVERILLRYVILPLADLVPWDVERRLQELGFSLGDIQAVNRVALRPVSYGAAVRRIAAQAKVTILSEEIVKRCRDILVSYIKGVRLMEQVKEMLMRSQRDGGIGFTLPQTEAFVSTMVEFLAKTEVLSEQAYADWFSAFQHQVASDRITDKQGSGAQQSAPQNDADNLPASTPSARTQEAQTALQTAVDGIYASLGWQGQDPHLAQRLHSIISTRMRDVRNALQVKEMLMREVAVGGMQMTQEEAERITQAIEAGYTHDRAAVVEEEKRKILEVQQIQEQKIAERKVRESQEHADWFERKVRTAQKDDEARRNFFVQMRESASSHTQQPTASVLSSAAPPPPVSMDPVLPPVRLVGLTEELEDMTIEMFRRMARVPGEAAKKIIQKLDALHEESFERWTQGVQAWRASPVQQAYLRLVGESFRAGESVIEIIEQKRKSDPTILTADEVGAILEINAHAQL